MFKKTFLFLLTAGAVLYGGFSTSAATFTVDGGILSIETPSENWVQTDSSDYWFMLTDGNDRITIERLQPEASLSDLIADRESYQAMGQAFITVDGEVYVVKGAAKAAASFQDIMQSIDTIRISKTGGSDPASDNTVQTAAGEFGIRAMDQTYYVTAYFLNVRSDYSAEAPIIDTYTIGKPVKVTGAVTVNGQDLGWYQIEYNGGNAYVSSQFLTETAFTVTPTPAAARTMTVYASDGTAVTLTLGQDKLWKDSKGYVYWLEVEATREWKNEKDELFRETYTGAGRTESGQTTNAASGQSRSEESSSQSSRSTSYAEAESYRDNSSAASSDSSDEDENDSESSSSYNRSTSDSASSSASYDNTQEDEAEEEPESTPAETEDDVASDDGSGSYDYLDGINDDEEDVDEDEEIQNVDDFGNDSGGDDSEYNDDDSYDASENEDLNAIMGSLVDPLQS